MGVASTPGPPVAAQAPAADPVAACIAGDAAAWRAVFDRHADVVLAYLRARVGAAYAEDVVVDAFATAWARRADIRPDCGSLRPWLLGIATNHVRRLRAVEARHAALAARARQFADRDAERDPGESLVDPELFDVLAHLPESEREVLLLVALGDLRVVDAAAALGIRPVAARMRLNRARARATRLLGKERP